MTVAELNNIVRFSVNRGDVANVNSKINDIASLARTTLGAIGIGFSAAKVKNFVKQCVSMASATEEMENKFNTVFQGITDEVDKWAEDYADAVGRNKNAIKGYVADQQNLLVGFGMAREEGAKLSEEMTSLALDLASFANINEDQAVNWMTKAVMGETEAAKQLGAVLSDTTRAETMAAMGLTGKYEALDQLTKMQVNYTAILRQSPDAIGDCVRSMNSYEATNRRYQARLKELKELIGNFFMPTAQQILSIGAKGLTLLRKGLTVIANVVNKLGGAERVVTVLGIAFGALFAAANINRVAAFANNIRKLLSGVMGLTPKVKALFFIVLALAIVVDDFIAFFKGDNSMIGELLTTIGVDAEGARQAVVNAFENIKSVVKNVWGSIKQFLSNHSEQIHAIMASVWGAIVEIFRTAFLFISTLAKAVFTALQAFWNSWGKDIIAVCQLVAGFISRAFSRMAEILTEVANLIKAIVSGDFKGAFEALKNIVATVMEHIRDLIQTIFSAILVVVVDIANRIAQAIQHGFNAAKNWVVNIVTSIYNSVVGAFQSMWSGVTAYVGNIKSAIVNGLTSAVNWIKALPAQALQWGKDIIDNLVSGILGAVDKVGNAVKGVANKIKGYLGFSEPDEGPLSNFHTYMPDMIDLMAQGINEGVPKIKKALTGLSGEMSVAANAKMVMPKTARGANGGNTVSKSIVQNVNINNKFEGDRAGQQKSATAMDKAGTDVTKRLADGLAFTR